MALNFKKIWEGLTLVKKSTSSSDASGDLEVVTIGEKDKLHYHDGTSSSPVVTEAQAATLTNKTIDYNLNTILNLPSSGGGAGGLDPDLSNIIASPFIISGQSNYKFPSDITFNQGSSPTLIRGKEFIEGEPSGGLTVFSGSTNNADSGYLNLFSGNIVGTGSGNTGPVSLYSGFVSPGNGTNNTGAVSVSSGYVQNGTSGATSFISGVASGSGVTGACTVGSGNSVSGNTGNVSISSGTTSATRGYVSLDGSYITVNSKRIQNVANPVATTDAVNKSITDALQTQINSINSGQDVAISALNIDWNLGTTFYKTITTNSTFTFSNVTNGKVISVIIKNSLGSNVSIVLPSGIYKTSSLNLTVSAGKTNVYTFIRSNSITYVSDVSDFAP